MARIFFYLVPAVLCFGLLLFTGCPSKAHLRPVPDYENMSDPHGGAGETEESEGEAADQLDTDGRG